MFKIFVQLRNLQTSYKLPITSIEVASKSVVIEDQKLLAPAHIRFYYTNWKASDMHRYTDTHKPHPKILETRELDRIIEMAWQTHFANEATREDDTNLSWRSSTSGSFVLAAHPTVTRD
jgi:hypothetical protein